MGGRLWRSVFRGGGVGARIETRGAFRYEGGGRAARDVKLDLQADRNAWRVSLHSERLVLLLFVFLVVLVLIFFVLLFEDALKDLGHVLD